MHQPESIQGKEKHKILWDFVIKMDHFFVIPMVHLIPTRKLDLTLINKKNILVI